MATATFLNEGIAVDYTASSAVTAGDVVVQGDLVGIAKRDIAAGAKGALAIRGAFRITKEAELAIAAGEVVYWDASGKCVTKTSEGNTLMGKAIAAAADSDATVDIILNQ